MISDYDSYKYLHSNCSLFKAVNATSLWTCRGSVVQYNSVCFCELSYCNC